MEFKFPRGAKLIREDGTSESLAGVAFELREQTKRDQLQAERDSISRKTDRGSELVRMSFTSFRGKPVVQPFADYSDLNLRASSFVERKWADLNGLGDDDPLEAT
jgi:hypothetical protein